MKKCLARCQIYDVMWILWQHFICIKVRFFSSLVWLQNHQINGKTDSCEPAKHSCPILPEIHFCQRVWRSISCKGLFYTCRQRHRFCERHLWYFYHYVNNTIGIYWTPFQTVQKGNADFDGTCKRALSHYKALFTRKKSQPDKWPIIVLTLCQWWWWWTECV